MKNRNNHIHTSQELVELYDIFHKKEMDAKEAADSFKEDSVRGGAHRSARNQVTNGYRSGLRRERTAAEERSMNGPVVTKKAYHFVDYSTMKRLSPEEQIKLLNLYQENFKVGLSAISKALKISAPSLLLHLQAHLGGFKLMKQRPMSAEAKRAWSDFVLGTPCLIVESIEPATKKRGRKKKETETTKTTAVTKAPVVTEAAEALATEITEVPVIETPEVVAISTTKEETSWYSTNTSSFFVESIAIVVKDLHDTCLQSTLKDLFPQGGQTGDYRISITPVK